MNRLGRKVRGFLFALLAIVTLVGCGAHLNEYQKQTPQFDLFGYFSGHVTAWGMVQDRSGKQTRRFEVALHGQVEGDTLTLHEDFVFADGENTTRIWRITRLADGSYEGRADDVVGVAQGREVGNALHWRYDFALPRGDSSVMVHFDDWLYRQDNEHVFNVTSIRKLGIEFGRLTLFFQKHSQP
ncbi:DUF3833 domain-containing protein [Vibrio rarus]|uniref:DUF3833 domain-containing protein n=1 Tax=Vibrio rarus TaxID=413403 RepID=UPI0021C3BA42|nr:DUF3833 domain-containing protein [Vibrio rarus]